MSKVTNLNGTPFVPGSDLTKQQAKIAARLRAIRPAVIPGTNAIVDETQQMVWWEAVSSAAVALEISEAQGKAFFDACGVAE